MSDKLPDARSGLPRPVEKRLLAPHAESVSGRVTSAAAVRAIGVLVRKHPRVALDIAAAALAQAARVAFAELKNRLTDQHRNVSADQVPPLGEPYNIPLDTRHLADLAPCHDEQQAPQFDPAAEATRTKATQDGPDLDLQAGDTAVRLVKLDPKKRAALIKALEAEEENQTR